MYKKFIVFTLIFSFVLQKHALAKSEDIEGFIKRFYSKSNYQFEHTKLIVQERVNKVAVQNIINIEISTLHNDIERDGISSDTSEKISNIRKNIEYLSVDSAKDPVWEAELHNLNAQFDLLENNVSNNNTDESLDTLDQIQKSIYFINQEEV